MCGIFGYVLKEKRPDLLQAANKIQAHRGPDGYGVAEMEMPLWKVGLAHQRLSIIDLSDSASQPMISNNGMEGLVYNGEIYNYKEIISSEGFGGNYGDTRALFESLNRHGNSYCSKLNGMWSFCYVDKKNQTLTLSRDRFGEKPLYLYEERDALYFASELKTLLAIIPKKFKLDYQVIGEFIGQGLTNFSNNSVLRGIKQIKPGCNVVFDLSNPDLRKSTQEYWNPDLSPIDLSFSDACEDISNILEDSVRLRLRSDVPVGVLLSGGIDSSAIASIMTKLSTGNDIHTLSAISTNPNLDERKHIKIMTDYLNAEPNTVTIDPSPNQAMNFMQSAIYHNDFPIADFSNVFHYILMQRAKELGLKVVLSGQGADELFCGYKKYLGFYALQLKRNGQFLELLSLITSFLLRGTIINQFNFREAGRYLGKGGGSSVFGEKLSSFSEAPIGFQKNMHLSDRQLYDIQKTSVPALTHYEDRMSMANGIEIRLPFLDHRLVEFALKIPESYKLNSGWTKFGLRKAIEDKLPKSIAWRKDKQGFLNPQSQWLKHDWKKIVLEHIQDDSLCSKFGIIDSNNMKKKYNDFLLGKPVWHREIFTVVSLEMWLRANNDNLDL
jgi:asparagine synthase (glutamine-hydrolysing)